jgi:23S rRNA (guanosine2251-2'-O)-methyltransferase
MAEVVERRLTDVEELLRTVAQADRQPFLLALDQVQDPYNLGSLLRTAHAAGAQGVIVPERRSAPVSGVVAKASAGAVSHLPILEVTNLARTLEALKKGGIWIVGLDGSAQEPIYGVDLTVPVALVVGGEGAGLRRLTREHCDLLLYIPMFGKVASLNAAVAGAIGMYELVRQRTTFAT